MDYRSSGRTSSSNYGYKSPKKQDDFLHVLLFYILPFIVFNGLLFFLLTTKPKVEITVGTTKDYKTTSVDVTVKSFLPLKSMVSTQESVGLPLEKTGRGTYTAAIDKNGVIEVTVSSINGMVAAAYEPVDILDDLPPSINEDFTIEDDLLTFTIEDSQSGVDFSSISGTTAMGTPVTPTIDKSNSINEDFTIEDDLLTFTIEDSQSGVDFSSISGTTAMGTPVTPTIDKSNGKISFEIDATGLTVYAADMCGNATQANFNMTSNDMTISGETENQVPAESQASGSVSPESPSEETSSSKETSSQPPSITITQ